MNELLDYISLYRVVWIRGRLGFGKTALAVVLAKKMLEMGLVDGVVTNFPSILPAHIKEDDGTLYNRCMIYDEAWADLDSRTSMTNERAYGAYARKMGSYWLFPSVHPIDKRLRAIEVAPMFRNIVGGTQTWSYKIQDDEKKPTMGRFVADARQAYYKYATSYIPLGDCGISDRFNYTFYLETGEFYDAQADKRAKRGKTEEKLYQSATME